MTNKLAKDIIQIIKGFEYEFDTSENMISCNIPHLYKIDAVQNEDFVKLMVYDCSSTNSFDYSVFVKEFEDIEEAASTIILVFNDWEQEIKIYNNCYEELSTQKERVKLSSIFASKIAFYKLSINNLKIDVEDNGINFLEYKTEKNSDDSRNDDDSIRGLIFNLRMSEIQKIFNVTGKNLFDQNVRLGIQDKRLAAKKINDNFKKYFKTYCYMNVEKKISEKLNTIWLLNHDEIMSNRPDYFWFAHNGITFFVDNETDDFSNMGSSLNLIPNNVSVINGAQTLTNIFYGINDLKYDVEKSTDLDAKQKNKVIDLLDEGLSKIYVKSIFILSSSKHVDFITNGLNTQIPILEEDSLAASETIDNINKKLSRKNIRVLKTGEKPGLKKGISVLELCKIYLSSTLKPGKSKNFIKTNMESVTKKIEEDLNNRNTSDATLSNIETVILISEWWPNRKKYFSSEKDNLITQNIEKYGKNYFESYVILNKSEVESDKDIINDEIIPHMYVKFMNDFKKYRDIELSTFKSDVKFDEYKQEHQTETIQNNIFSINSEELVNYLNDLPDEDKKSKSWVNINITKFLIKQNIDDVKFRTISLIQKSGKNYVPKENFSFPSETFDSIYEGKDFLSSNENVNFDKFESSKLYQYLESPFVLFAIYYNDEKSIDRVEIKQISFNKYLKEAKKAYNQTIDAFQKGSYSDMPKLSDKLGFHVRPKALNSEDTFVFSDGSSLTKRTFWANAELMATIINDDDEVDSAKTSNEEN